MVARGVGITHFFSGMPDTVEDMWEIARTACRMTPVVSLATTRKIKAFATMEPTIVLPADDPEGPRRLTEKWFGRLARSISVDSLKTYCLNPGQLKHATIGFTLHA